MKCLFETDSLKRLRIPSVGIRVPEHPLDVHHLGFVIPSALAQERPPDIAIQIDRLARARILRDEKCQNNSAIDDKPLLLDLNVMIDLHIGMEDGQEIVLDFIWRLDARNIQCLARLRNAENQPPTVCVCKGRDGFKGRLRDGIPGLFEFNIIPFPRLQKIFN